MFDMPAIRMGHSNIVENVEPVTEHYVSAPPVQQNMHASTAAPQPPVPMPENQPIPNAPYQPPTMVPQQPQMAGAAPDPGVVQQQHVQYPGAQPDPNQSALFSRFDQLRSENQQLYKQLEALKAQSQHGDAADRRIGELTAKLNQTQSEYDRLHNAVRHMQKAFIEREAENSQTLDGISSSLHKLRQSLESTEGQPVAEPAPLPIDYDSTAAPVSIPQDTNFSSFGSPRAHTQVSARSQPRPVRSYSTDRGMQFNPPTVGWERRH